MATIRIPASAEPLLQFCRTSGSDESHIWETYADMVAFLAVYAFGQGEIPMENPRGGKAVSPIEIGVFRSRGLYPLLLALAIADRREWLVVKSMDEVAAIAERYADAGARLLSFEATSGGHGVLSQRLVAELGTFKTLASTPTI